MSSLCLRYESSGELLIDVLQDGDLTPARESKTIWFQVCGSSKYGECPPAGISTTWAFGNTAATCRDQAGKFIGSSLPTRQSTGQVSFFKAS